MRKSWPSVPLGEVLRERQETPTADALASGEIRIVSKIGFNDGVVQFRAGGETKTGMILIRPGDLVVSGINAGKGAIAIYDEQNTEPVAATIHYGAYIPNKDRVDVRFLWWLLRSGTFRELLLEYVPGGIKTELKAKRLLPIPVPLPDLAEQRRIVVRIEQLAAQIEEARRHRQQATEETEALMGSALNKTFAELLRQTSGVALDSVASIVGGGSLPEVPEESNGDSDIMLVKVSDMNRPGNETTLRSSATSLGKDSPYLRGCRILPKDSIVFPKRGGAIATNKKRLLARPAILDPNMMGVSSRKTDSLDPSYLFRWFQSFDLASLQSGTSVPQINKVDLAPLLIPVPPLPEQRRIVGYLDGLAGKVAALARLQSETASALDALLPSVLDKAFKGEL